jgi:hypothetical protein
MGQQLLSDTEQNLSDVLLLSAGEVSPKLMGSNQAVGLVRRCRSGGMDSHRC